ncbi:MAG: zinc-ribbon domain-containing protein [Thomasclavelia sp.]
MKCKKCGEKNEKNALFCANCGIKLEKKSIKKNKMLIAVIILAIFVSIGMIMTNIYENSYDGKLSKARKYVEEADYEKAEAEYLEVIDIEPRLPEPYVELADVYIEQYKTDEAVDIMQKAVDNVDEEYESDIFDKKEEVDEKVIGLQTLEKIYKAFENDNLVELYALIKDIGQLTGFFYNEVYLNDNDRFIYIPENKDSGTGIGMYFTNDFSFDCYPDLGNDNALYLGLYVYYGKFEKDIRSGEFKVAQLRAEDFRLYEVTIDDNKVNGDSICMEYVFSDSGKDYKMECKYYYYFVDGKIDGKFEVDDYENDEYNCTLEGSATNGNINRIVNEETQNRQPDGFVIAFNYDTGFFYYYPGSLVYDEDNPPTVILP